MSCTDKNTMVFVVLEGEITVILHTTQFNAKKGDSFYIPPKVCVVKFLPSVLMIFYSELLKKMGNIEAKRKYSFRQKRFRVYQRV